MFDLEVEIQKWRREMAATGLAPEILAELEGHLRDDVERQVHSGVDVSAALQAALQRIGEPDALRTNSILSANPLSPESCANISRSFWFVPARDCSPRSCFRSFDRHPTSRRPKC
jgi:hypothetical protein